MAVPYFAHGATFTFNGHLVGGITTLDGPSETSEEVESTSHDSGGRREFLPGLIDSGTIDLTVRNDPADTGQAEMHANFGSQTPVPCVLTGPPQAAHTYTFDAFLQSRSAAHGFDAVAEGTFTLRITGDVTITPAS